MYICSLAMTAHSSLASLVQVGFETEGTSIYDTIQYISNEVSFQAINAAASFAGSLAMHSALPTIQVAA